MNTILPQDIRLKIQNHLQEAARLMQEALLLAEDNGWPDSLGRTKDNGKNLDLIIYRDTTACIQADKDPESIVVRAKYWKTKF